MNTRQLFKQKIIELIHKLDYEEAIKLEPNWCNDENDEEYLKPIITLSRVMQALDNCKKVSSTSPDDCWITKGNIKFIFNDGYYGFTWKLLKEDKSTATDDEQTDETIEALYKLIK